MPEVFSKENKNYYIYNNSKNSNGSKAKFSNEEILTIRKRYVNETPKKYIKIIKIELDFKDSKLFYGAVHILLYLFIRKKKSDGLIFEPVSTIP